MRILAIRDGRKRSGPGKSEGLLKAMPLVALPLALSGCAYAVGAGIGVGGGVLAISQLPDREGRESAQDASAPAFNRSDERGDAGAVPGPVAPRPPEETHASAAMVATPDSSLNIVKSDASGCSESEPERLGCEPGSFSLLEGETAFFEVKGHVFGLRHTNSVRYPPTVLEMLDKDCNPFIPEGSDSPTVLPKSDLEPSTLVIDGNRIEVSFYCSSLSGGGLSADFDIALECERTEFKRGRIHL